MGHKGLIGSLIFIAILFLGVVPIFPVEEAYTEMEPYQETYEAIEQYQRQVRYNIIDSDLVASWSISLGTHHIYTVVLQNTDDYGGYFQVSFELYDVEGLFEVKSDRHYIGAGGTETFRAEFDTKTGQDVRGERYVSAPTVTDQRIVTQTRTAYRKVVKYRTVSKSLLVILTEEFSS